MYLKCMCGKEYKTEKGFNKHINICEYSDMDIEKTIRVGKVINTYSNLFHVHFGKLNKYKKINKCTRDEAYEYLLEENIYKYRKTLWDILQSWETELLPSEYREFVKWVFKTYKDISLLSLRNTLSNTKIMYRFSIENTNNMIEKRIDDSLRFIHNKHTYHNDFDFVDDIIVGDISMYYILFNDWLATKWFGKLESDLQKDLTDYIEIASKIIVERLTPDEFDNLQKLANSDTPQIYKM